MNDWITLLVIICAVLAFVFMMFVLLAAWVKNSDKRIIKWYQDAEKKDHERKS